MMRTLFLQAPSFDGYDGGAGARYQARREIQSYWYPTWLAQPAALVAGSKLIDAPPHRLKFADVAPEANARNVQVVLAIVEDCFEHPGGILQRRWRDKGWPAPLGGQQ